MRIKKLHRLGILTGGGDCPGLNAVIRSVTKTAIHQHGMEVFGIEDGYQGLLEKRGRFLSSDDVSGILTHGGTILGTSNRANPFLVSIQKGRKIMFKDQSDRAIKHFKEWCLDGLIVVGGDGTLTIAQKLLEKGIRVIGIPKTIDNDLSETDFTFGFDSAVAIATDAIDRLHTTAASHHRVMVLEVMGRQGGWIALFAGAAGGADVILIPEIPFHWNIVADQVLRRAKIGKRFSLIVVAEGAHEKGKRPVVENKDRKNYYGEKLGGIGKVAAQKIEQMTGVEARSAVLGHIQRGGSPTPFDRILGTLFGVAAVNLFADNLTGRMICLKGRTIRSVSLKQAIRRLKRVPPDHPLIQSARSVGTSFGDRKGFGAVAKW